MPTRSFRPSRVRLRQLAVLATGLVLLDSFTSTAATAAEHTSVRPRPSFDPVFEKLGGTVNTIEPGANGKFYVGGTFTHFAGAEATPLVRLISDGSRDTSYAPHFVSGRVDKLAVLPDDRLIVAGGFARTAESFRSGLFRISTDGIIDETFAPNVSGGSGSLITAMALQADGRIAISGNFTHVGGVARSRLARLNADGTLDATFNPGAGINGPVYALAIQSDGAIIVGGSFTAAASRNASAPRLRPFLASP